MGVHAALPVRSMSTPAHNVPADGDRYVTACGSSLPVSAAALDDGWTALMPVGAMVFLDGRKYTLHDPAAVIAASPTERALVDFDHGADTPGGRSEAAGWIEEFSLDRMPGFIAARVNWTESGRRALADRLYRFISPSFRHDAKRRVVQIVRAGLTNRPAIAELPALANETKGDTMTHATEDRAAAEAEAVTALKAELATAAAACVTATAERDAALAKAAELTAALDAAHAEAEANRRAQLIATAAREGKVVPAMDEFLKSLSREQLAAYLAAAPVVVTAAAGATAGTGSSADTITPAQAKLINNLGISREGFLAAKPAPESV